MSSEHYSNDKLGLLIGSELEGAYPYFAIMTAIEHGEERGLKILLDLLAQRDLLKPYDQLMVTGHVNIIDWSNMAFRTRIVRCLLAEILETDVYHLRRFALDCLLEILGQYPDRQVRNRLLCLFRDKDTKMQWEALSFFEYSGETEALPDLIRFLESDNLSFVDGSIRALQNIPIPAISVVVKQRLLNLLFAESVYTRKEAIRFFQKHKDSDAVPLLALLLDDPEADVVKASREALLIIGTTDAHACFVLSEWEKRQ